MDLDITPEEALAGWHRRERRIAAALFVASALVFGLHLIVWAQPADGTDGLGMLSMTLLFGSLALLAGALVLTVQAHDRLRAARNGKAVWYPVPASDGRDRYWNGESWVDEGAEPRQP